MPTIKKTNLQKSILRKSLTQARIHAATQNSSRANSSLLSVLSQLRVYRMAKNIAIYLPFKSEFPTATIIERNLQLNKKSYVPHISSIRHKKMKFVQLHKKAATQFLGKRQSNLQLKKNAYGIFETTSSSESKSPQSLDIIFVPLLGFNHQGDRLGMGGGYYDRLLSFKIQRQHIRKPYLIGLAYEAQYSELIQRDTWDVQLDMVITEEATYTYKTTLL